MEDVPQEYRWVWLILLRNIDRMMYRSLAGRLMGVIKGRSDMLFNKTIDEEYDDYEEEEDPLYHTNLQLEVMALIGRNFS